MTRFVLLDALRTIDDHLDKGMSDIAYLQDATCSAYYEGQLDTLAELKELVTLIRAQAGDDD